VDDDGVRGRGLAEQRSEMRPPADEAHRDSVALAQCVLHLDVEVRKPRPDPGRATLELREIENGLVVVVRVAWLYAVRNRSSTASS
jgi:hypothetical protein